MQQKKTGFFPDVQLVTFDKIKQLKNYLPAINNDYVYFVKELNYIFVAA